MRDVTEAAFWFDRCAERVGADPERLLGDRWVRRLLSEAAVTVLPTGVNGYTYRFPDRSQLIVTSELVQATRR